MSHKVTLDYDLPKGRLAPYFEALARGRALSESCDACGRVQFPPSGACGACGGQAMTWKPLSGVADVLHRTDTPDTAFALARFLGADNAALVRIENTGVVTLRGQLRAAAGEAAGLAIELMEGEDT